MLLFSRTRRATVPAVLAAGIVLAATACGGGADNARTAGPDTLDPNADLSKQTLTVSNWDGYMPQELPEKFKAAKGPTVTVTKHATNEEIIAKLTAGGDSHIDVAFVSGQFAQALNAQGLLEPIHADLVPNLKNLYPEAGQLAYDKGNTFSVPYTWGTTGLCYRTDLAGYTPDSWEDLLTPKPQVAKKVTMMATERWLMLPAQKSLNFSANTTDTKQLEQVKQQLLAAKKTLLAYDDTTFGDRLKSGEAALVESWDGWCPTDDSRIKFVVPKEGSDLWVDTMVILKTSKNKEAAHAFINYILDADNHSWAATNILYKVPNAAAMAKVDANVLESHPQLRMTPAELLKNEVPVDLGDAAPTYTRIATEVSAA
ncbi:spermidine/putrescine ABC transporter substrate-binding protein [Dactylosporangium salmoneum]|uniref:Spermidine/putrescine ABC transporter substrate-binding protein n=1 Tax=Dactylosporangium salmoneum TaxID=53361 RepID=A0ABP5TJ56_9ACTN